MLQRNDTGYPLTSPDAGREIWPGEVFDFPEHITGCTVLGDEAVPEQAAPEPAQDTGPAQDPDPVPPQQDAPPVQPEDTGHPGGDASASPPQDDAPAGDPETIMGSEGDVA